MRGTPPGPAKARRGAAGVAWTLGAVAAALLVAGLLDAAVQDARDSVTDDLRHIAVFALATGALSLHARSVTGGRRVWIAFAIGSAINTVAEAVSVAFYDDGTGGVAGALYALAYLATGIGLASFLRRRVGDALGAFSADALGLALSLGAVGCAVLLRPMIEHGGVDEADGAVTLVFTAADLAIAGVVWAVASFSGRRRARQDQLLAASLAVMFCGDLADVLHRAGILTGTGSWSRLLWELSMLLVAAAAAARPTTAGALRVGGWWELAPTVFLAVSGTGVLVAAYAFDLPVAAVVLAVATLVTMGVRGSRVQLEVRRLVVMRAESLVDEATGAANQRALFAELELLTREDGRDGRRAALLIGHLEGFGELTDTLGHAVAGDVLRRVAARLADVASGTFARLDNGEFATIVEDADPDAVAGVLAAALAAPVESDGVAISVRPVFGYARFPQDARTPTDLARHADMARRDARDRGLGVAAYDPDRDTHSRDRLTLAADLRCAPRPRPATTASGWRSSLRSTRAPARCTAPRR